MNHLNKVLSNDKSIEDFGIVNEQEEVYIAANDTFSEDDEEMADTRKVIQSKSTLEPSDVKPSLAQITTVQEK